MNNLGNAGLAVIVVQTVTAVERFRLAYSKRAAVGFALIVRRAHARACSVVSTGGTIGAWPAQQHGAVAKQAVMVVQTVAAVGGFGLAYCKRATVRHALTVFNAE